MDDINCFHSNPLYSCNSVFFNNLASSINVCPHNFKNRDRWSPHLSLGKVLKMMNFNFLLWKPLWILLLGSWSFVVSWWIPMLGEFWQIIHACLPVCLVMQALAPVALRSLRLSWGLVLIEATWCQAYLESEPITIIGLCVRWAFCLCVFSNKADMQKEEKNGRVKTAPLRHRWSPTDSFFFWRSSH